MDLTFTEILWLIIAILIGIIAVKITFTFDINKYLESKQEKLKGKIKNHCTHVYIKKIDNNIELESSFNSPVGTVNFICQKCGLIVPHCSNESEQGRLKELLKDPKKLIEQENKF